MSNLPVDVVVRSLPRFSDDRGSLFEAFRPSASALPPAVQWNVVDSEPHVMRGMHAHLAYDEYYVVLDGTMIVGLRDTRPGSPTEGRTAVLTLEGARPQLVAMPTGIMHGIHAATRCRLLVGLAREWDGGGEIGCHWTDPALGLDWKLDPVRLSSRDAALPPLREVQAQIPPYRKRPSV